LQQQQQKWSERFLYPGNFR